MSHLTPDKDAVLTRLNEDAQREHTKAVEKAFRQGKVAPAAPAPLTPEQVEYPKWLYSGGQSKLVKDKAEHEALGAGWVDSPAKVGTKEADPEAKPKK